MILLLLVDSLLQLMVKFKGKVLSERYWKYLVMYETGRQNTYR